MTDISQLLSEGLDHYLNGRMELAAAAFHEALRLEPGNDQAADFLAATLGVPDALESQDTFAPLNLGAQTAWDDGPQASAAVEVVDDPAMQAPVLDHFTQRHTSKTEKITAANKRQAESHVEEAKRFESLGDFTSAYERAERALGLIPNHAEAAAISERAAATLLQMYESRLGPLDGVPEVIVKPDEMIWLGLDHRAGFVLAQIDGVVNYDELYAVCGMAPLDTARVLSQLLEQKVIRTKSRAGVRPRLR